MAESHDATEHDVLLWANPPGGKTMKGEVLPAGWVWTCSCKGPYAWGCGFPTEDDADDASTLHVLDAQLGGEHV